MKFTNRKQAGVLLSKRIQSATLIDPIVLALPRGGLPVAHEIALALNVPLDVLVVRKIGAPEHEEFGIGAVTENNFYGLDYQVMQSIGASSLQVDQILDREREEVQRRVELYRKGRPLPRLRNRSVIVVDDGLATGVTARVACAFIKGEGAAEVILAIPVCAADTAKTVRAEVDQLVCLEESQAFFAVSQFYAEFAQVSDAEVLSFLDSKKPEKKPEDDPMITVRSEIAIGERGVHLAGSLAVPPGAKGIVLFAHGSGSSRLSPRNRQVAQALNAAGLGTLLFDLLSPEEARDTRNVFDIPLLAHRLLLAASWVRKQEYLRELPLGFFGASTGGGAALWAATDWDDDISAVVSRGGRPDLAGSRLSEVSAPTLLIVGALDKPVLALNKAALGKLRNGKLSIVPSATHLFEEPGAMEMVEEEATSWFLEHFRKQGRRKAA